LTYVLTCITITPMNNKTKQRENHVSLRMGKDALSNLVKHATADDRSVSALIRIAIDEYLKTKKPIQ